MQLHRIARIQSKPHRSRGAATFAALFLYMAFDRFAVVVVKFWSRRFDERHKDVKTTMVVTHLLNRGGCGVTCPAFALCVTRCWYHVRKQDKTPSHYDLARIRKTGEDIRGFLAEVSFESRQPSEDSWETSYTLLGCSLTSLKLSLLKRCLVWH